MKRVSFLLAMLALVLVFGLAFVSCGGDDGNNSGGGDTQGGGDGLTVTGLPAYKWYAYVPQSVSVAPTLSGVSQGMRNPEAVSDRIIYNRFLFSYTANNARVRWRGSGNRSVILEGMNGRYTSFYVGTVNFTNGNATIAFSRFTWVRD